jgi:hypothetical protein
MFAVLNLELSSLKSGLLHLTGQPYCRKGRSANVKDGIINLCLRNYLIDQCTIRLGLVRFGYVKLGLVRLHRVTLGWVRLG